MDPITQEANSVQVEIFDRVFNLTLKRGIDPEYFLKLGQYVDSKMRARADGTDTVDSARLAVFAALDIAHECHLLKAKLEDDKKMSGEECA